MNSANVWTIASFIIAFLGVAFAVYSHFKMRRFADLSYEATQLTDYKLPSDILSQLNTVPFSVLIKSTGNKKAEDINIRITTVSDITNLVIDSGEILRKEQTSREVKIRIPSLNPKETIKISGQCYQISGLKAYITEMIVTHSEGAITMSKSQIVAPREVDKTEAYIISKHSGKCLNVWEGNLSDGAIIVQHRILSGDNQKWVLRNAGEGYYHIIAKHSGKCLDVPESSQDNAKEIIQYPIRSTDNQKWLLQPVESGYYRIVAKHSAKCLDVWEASEKDGAKIVQHNMHEGDNQKWMLLRAESLVVTKSI